MLEGYRAMIVCVWGGVPLWGQWSPLMALPPGVCTGLVDQICGCGNGRVRHAQRFGFSSWGKVEPFTELEQAAGGAGWGAFLLAM